MLFCSSCNVKNSDKKEISNKLNVYTSFYAMYDFTSKIGGDKINIKNLVPSGIEPHDYEPSPSDIASLEKADILIYNGAGMEGWIDKVLDSLNNKNLVIVETSKGLKLIENTDIDEDLKYDPHVWLNPQNAKKQMEIIKDALVSKDPQNKEYYEKNYAENAKKIDKLDKEYKDAVSKFKTKDIVVSHCAFGYLCDAYNLNQIAIEGLLADSEPTPSKMAQIVKFAKENNVKYIFFEELISPKVAQTIAREVNAKTAVLNPFEGLKDEDIKAGKDYFSVMRENLKVLKEALQ
nr:metal ABC transporter substrate-binding protein [Caloramator sp. E03]